MAGVERLVQVARQVNHVPRGVGDLALVSHGKARNADKLPDLCGHAIVLGAIAFRP